MEVGRIVLPSQGHDGRDQGMRLIIEGALEFLGSDDAFVSQVLRVCALRLEVDDYADELDVSSEEEPIEL